MSDETVSTPEVAPEAPPPAEVDASSAPVEAAETPVEEKPAPAPEKVAAKFAALAREEKRIRQEREALKRERAEVDTVKVKWNKIHENPVDAIRELGLEPEEFVRRVISDGKPTTEWELEQLKKRVEAQEKERQEYAAKQQQAEYMQTVNAAKVGFTSFIDESAEKYPLLYECEPVRIGEAGWMAANKLYDELGRVPTHDEIAEALEAELKPIYKVRDERRAALEAKKKPVAPAADTSKSKTLSNTQASQKGTVPRERTQEEIDVECIRILEAAIR